jgi:hypothetical protein
MADDLEYEWEYVHIHRGCDYNHHHPLPLQHQKQKIIPHDDNDGDDNCHHDETYGRTQVQQPSSSWTFLVSSIVPPSLEYLFFLANNNDTDTIKNHNPQQEQPQPQPQQPQQQQQQHLTEISGRRVWVGSLYFANALVHHYYSLFHHEPPSSPQSKHDPLSLSPIPPLFSPLQYHKYGLIMFRVYVCVLRSRTLTRFSLSFSLSLLSCLVVYVASSMFNRYVPPLIYKYKNIKYT